MIEFIYSAIIAYFGLAVGIILVHMTEEEMKPGKPHFIKIHNILLAVILLLILNAYNSPGILQLALPLVAVYLLSKKEYYKKSYLFYPILGIILALAFQTAMFVAITTLTFFYGFITSALTYNPKKILQHASFLL